jgi:hypothetical protein
MRFTSWNRHVGALAGLAVVILLGACNGSSATSSPMSPPTPPPTLTSITIGLSGCLAVGATVPVMVTATYSDASMANVTSQASLSLTGGSGTSLVGTNVQGTVSTATGGTLQATYGGIMSPALPLTVAPIGIASVMVTPGSSNLTAVPATSQQFTATATYSDSTASVPHTADVTTSASTVWSGPLPYATVSAGLVTGAIAYPGYPLYVYATVTNACGTPTMGYAFVMVN